jgi:hypothetical protein
MKRILRPFGLIGCVVLGGVAAYFFHDKIKGAVDKVAK